VSDKHKDGEPAIQFGSWNVTERFSEGMSLRNYFAGQALAGLLAQLPGDSRKVAVDLAYRLADEMLVERVRKESQP
jgi:hypothetical protein